MIINPKTMENDPTTSFKNLPNFNPKNVKVKLSVENTIELYITLFISIVKPTPKLSRLTPNAKRKISKTLNPIFDSFVPLISLNIWIEIYKKITLDKRLTLILR